jgi:hypothetical protein
MTQNDVRQINERLNALATQVAGLATTTQLLANQLVAVRSSIDALGWRLHGPTSSTMTALALVGALAMLLPMTTPAATRPE